MVEEPSTTAALTKRATEIMDVKYTPADLDSIIHDCSHLSTIEKKKLSSLLYKYKILFDGTLGNFNVEPATIELKKDAQPVQLRPFQVPHVWCIMFKNELSRLVQIGVLVKISNSHWSSLSFLIPKKDGRGRFLSDFRKLNILILRKPYLTPRILDLIQTLEGFTYATALDLNMGYYKIKLDPTAQDYFTIVTP